MKLLIDKEKHLVKKNDDEIILPKKEFEILWLLSQLPGKVFSRKTIFHKIWGNSCKSKEKTVDVHFVNLRKKLGDNVFRTIKGVGYKIIVDNITVINSSKENEF